MGVPTAKVMKFSEGEAYEQEEPGIAKFAWLVKDGEIDGICMGLVTLEGPIVKTPAAHDTWDQVYLVMEGTATIHLGGKSTKIEGPTVVVIPRNTNHSMECKAGERVRYVFINEYFAPH